MKLILSRKGFDSGYGGIPSPILPDGSLVPLPIPTQHDCHTLADINFKNIDLGGLLAHLSNGRHNLKTKVHLDPDLDRPSGAKLPGWRPALGQTGNAQSHLRDMGVGVGDVFLFFGWFRAVDRIGGMWRYIPSAPHLHVIFGWLEVSAVLYIVTERDRCLLEYPWIRDHPHVLTPTHYEDARNTLYVAASSSRYGPTHRHGGGRFEKYTGSLRLTKPGESRSVWSLPRWFYPVGDRLPLSYHPNLDRWCLDDERVTLRSAAKGQEFVLDGNAYSEADSWITSVISGSTSP